MKSRRLIAILPIQRVACQYSKAVNTRPETKNFTETVRLLAGMSRFVIVDITNPTAPLELQAAVPECMVPFVPILDKSS